MATARSQANRSLRKVLSRKVGIPKLFRTFDDFEKNIGNSPDERAMVLLISALLEQILEEVILTRCIKAFDKESRLKLFGPGPEGGAIGGFYGKIVLGHA